MRSALVANLRHAVPRFAGGGAVALALAIVAIALLALVGLAIPASASSDGAVEAKVLADLEGLLARSLPRERFVVQVGAPTEIVSEKRLVEGETLVQNLAAPSIDVPLLPGFDPEPSAPAAAPPTTSRQTFRMVDRVTLTSVSVQLALDETLGEDLSRRTEAVVRQYLTSNYGAKGKLSVARLRMLPPKDSAWSSLSPAWVIGALAMILAIALLAILYQARKRPPTLYPTIQDDGAEVSRALRGPGSPRTFAPEKRSLALPSGDLGGGGRSYPALPATEIFVDRRSDLIREFLRNSETFRLYFRKLPGAARSELYAGLRGPAFDSLLEALGLEIPAGSDTLTPPSEDQLLFYQKNFVEFIEANDWQSAQFFGFLKDLKDEELLTLAKGENPLVNALMIKFLNPEQSAHLLTTLSAESRLAILSQMARVQQIQTDELRSIEQSVRARVELLPRFLSGGGRGDDLAFWTRILAKTEAQESILLDLEQTRPDLYPALARFRFRLEDAPSLPPPLIARVLEQVENDELALALLGCSTDVVEFLLAEMNAGRRSLVRSQMKMYQGVQSEKATVAQSTLTGRFREVMA